MRFLLRPICWLRGHEWPGLPFGKTRCDRCRDRWRPQMTNLEPHNIVSITNGAWATDYDRTGHRLRTYQVESKPPTFEAPPVKGLAP